MATGSTVTHYCDWAISMLIQPATVGELLHVKLLSWLHAGSALFTVTGLPPAPPPPSTSECVYLHLHRSRLKAIIVPARRGQRVSRLLIQQGLKIFPLMLS